MNLSSLRALVDRLADAAAIPRPDDKALSKYASAPDHVMETVAVHVVDSAVRRHNRPPARNHVFYSREKKYLLAEAQNHRCCYCGTAVSYNYPDDIRYATIEHVVDVSLGGRLHEMNNLVIACQMCNGMRDQMKVSAYLFYVWVRDKRDEYNERVAKSVAGRNYRRRIKRVGKRTPPKTLYRCE